MSLRRFIQELSQSASSHNHAEADIIVKILAKSYLKHGDWQLAIDGGLTTVRIFRRKGTASNFIISGKGECCLGARRVPLSHKK